MKSAFILVSLWLTIHSLASADTNSIGGPPPQVPGRRVEQDLAKWDTNHNGRLDAAEGEALRQERLPQRQAETEARIKAAAEARQLDELGKRTSRVSPLLFPRYDLNTNGVIDVDEWNAYRRDVERISAEKRRMRLATNGTTLEPIQSTSTNR